MTPRENMRIAIASVICLLPNAVDRMDRGCHFSLLRRDSQLHA
jgi:hypothetical protein